MILYAGCVTSYPPDLMEWRLDVGWGCQGGSDMGGQLLADAAAPSGRWHRHPAQEAAVGRE